MKVPSVFRTILTLLTLQSVIMWEILQTLIMLIRELDNAVLGQIGP